MMLSKEVAGVGMLERIARAWCTMFFVRMKYYFAWKVSVVLYPKTKYVLLN